MGLFKKKADPISERSRELKDQIAALESKIQKLSSQIGQTSGLPSAAVFTTTDDLTPLPQVSSGEPIFEESQRSRLQLEGEPMIAEEHYNEMGVRKFDLPGLIRRIQNHFRPKPVSNPRLLTYLAAGTVQGLRPLRYEKRVARNRFIVLASIFLVILWGLLAIFLRR